MKRITSIVAAVQIVVGIASLPSSGQTVRTGPVFNADNGHIYYMLTLSSWSDAEAFAQGLGGHLVTIDDRAENDWIVATFGSQAVQGLWIGLHDANGDNNWRWVSGQASAYRQWDPGEPNNIGQERWVEMVPRGLSGRWNNRRQDWQQYPSQGIVELDRCPSQCAADVNCDGVLSTPDFFDFVALFFADLPAADFNADAVVNSGDFFDFLASFLAGC